jgi:hypothetical protein
MGAAREAGDSSSSLILYCENAVRHTLVLSVLLLIEPRPVVSVVPSSPLTVAVMVLLCVIPRQFGSQSEFWEQALNAPLVHAPEVHVPPAPQSASAEQRVKVPAVQLPVDPAVALHLPTPYS